MGTENDAGTIRDDPARSRISLLDIPPVDAADWGEKVGSAESAGSAVVIFYTSTFATNPIFQLFVENLTERILPHAGPYQLFRFALDHQPKFATNLLRRVGIWNVKVQNGGLLWSGKGTLYVLGDQAFASSSVLNQHLSALCVNREIKLPSESPLTVPDVASEAVSAVQATPAIQSIGLRPAYVVGGLTVLLVIAGIVLFSGNPAYVSQCRSLWWEQSGRVYPAVDVSYQRAGSGEMTRHSDNRLVGYYTDFIITLKFDNFGKQGRINLQCVSNSQKTFVYMKTDDPDWIGGKSGPIGVSFVRANGTYSPFPPDLD